MTLKLYVNNMMKMVSVNSFLFFALNFCRLTHHNAGTERKQATLEPLPFALPPSLSPLATFAITWHKDNEELAINLYWSNYRANVIYTT